MDNPMFTPSQSFQEPLHPRVGVVTVDAQGLVCHLDAAAQAITGWTLPEARGQAVEEVVRLADEAQRPGPRSAASARTLLMSSQVCSGHQRLLSRAGGFRSVQLTAAPVIDRQGRLANVVLTLCETAVDAVVAAADDRLRMVVQSMPVMMDAFDENRLISVWNSECERVTGFSAEEVIGNPDALLLMYPDQEYRERMLKEWTARGNDYRNWAWEITCKDGSKRTIEWSNVSQTLPIRGWTTWGIGVDVTERLRLEASVRQSQKMDAIGQLAGGVAHDFNNLLTVINGCAEEILELSEREATIRPLADMIRETAQRASLLTRQLLLFSRRGSPRIEHLDINEILRRCTHLLERTLGEQVLLRVDVGETVGIQGDATQVEQVIFNLCLNARDAMPQGGALVLSTERAVVNETDLRMWPEAKPGRFVLLTVSDAGTGMSDEVKAHLFEPFFTTKAVGSGTGLGLATVFGIVRSMRGFLIVESQVGAGTTVRVFLPEADAAVERGTPPRNSEQQVGGRETLLVVEDDLWLRRLVVRRLTANGYRVLEASSGKEALARATSSDFAIDLLVTDIVMPGMRGDEVASALRARRPNLRLLFMTGYSPDVALRDAHRLGGQLLQKPFTMSELLATVRRVLDEPQADASMTPAWLAR